MHCEHGQPFTMTHEGLGFCYHRRSEMWFPYTLTKPTLPGWAYSSLLWPDGNRRPAFHWQPVYSEQAARVQVDAEVQARRDAQSTNLQSQFSGGPTIPADIFTTVRNSLHSYESDRRRNNRIAAEERRRKRDMRAAAAGPSFKVVTDAGQR